MIKSLGVGLLVGLAMMCAVNWAQGGDLVVRNAWIRAAPPSAQALAAYMVITNNGPRPVQLLAVTCPDFETVEIHETAVHQGMMHMMARQSLPIKPGEPAVLAPGGNHIMLIGPRRQVRDGEQIILQLRFDQGEELMVPVAVRQSEQ